MSIKFFLCMLAILTVLSVSIATESGNRIAIRIKNPPEYLLDTIITADYEVLRFREQQFIDVFLPAKELEDMISLEIDYEVLFDELEMLNNMQLKTRDLPGYRNYNNILTELEDIETEYNHIARLYNIGNSRGNLYYNSGNDSYSSYQNHHIWALKITDNPDEANDRPAVYFNGAHHAREPISAEMVMLIAYHLVYGYGTDPDITHLVDNTEIWLIPLLNPDGHKLVTTQSNINWRKNIRDNNDNGIFNSNYDGVDLNRNYSYEWAQTSPPSASNYSGPSPFSEPELAAFKNLLESRKFVAGISYHSYGQYVLFPPGYISGLYSPDAQAQSSLASAMAQTIPRITGTGHYTAQHSWQFYPATGTAEDYAYCTHGVFAHTLEMATQFIPPHTQAQQICEDNLEAAMILMRRGHHSTLTGLVSEFLTANPLTAEIFVIGIDDTGVHREPYTSCNDFGRYYRLLLPGLYNARYSAPGFFTAPLSEIEIIDSLRTVNDIELIPLIPVTFSEGSYDNEGILLSWDQPCPDSFFGDGADLLLPYDISLPMGYNVYRDSLLINAEYHIVETEYLDQNAEEGELYSYQIAAVYEEGEAELSPPIEVCFQPDMILPPHNISISIQAENVYLEWSPVEQATSYKVYYSPEPCADNWIELSHTGNTSWQGNLINSQGYFRVTAVFNF
jgi:carboxypeptidase T